MTDIVSTITKTRSLSSAHNHLLTRVWRSRTWRNRKLAFCLRKILMEKREIEKDGRNEGTEMGFYLRLLSIGRKSKIGSYRMNSTLARFPVMDESVRSFWHGPVIIWSTWCSSELVLTTFIVFTINKMLMEILQPHWVDTIRKPCFLKFQARYITDWHLVDISMIHWLEREKKSPRRTRWIRSTYKINIIVRMLDVVDE